MNPIDQINEDNDRRVEEAVTVVLMDAGINDEMISYTPNGVWTITAASGARLAFGEDEDDDGNTEGWVWTIYDPDGSEVSIDFADDLPCAARAVARAVATWAR